MKPSFLLLLLALPFAGTAQWNLIYAHADYENAMAVLNKDTVVCVTDNGGRVHRTTNGGQGWSFYQTMFTTSWFTDVHFPTQTTGYACGGTAFGLHTNVIIKTVNAGQTWDSVTCNAYTGYSFNKIFFVHPDTGFVSGEFNGLLKTVNGGGTFTPVSIPDGGVVSAIHFTGSQTGLAATYKFISPASYVYCIQRTVNQGASWTKVYTDTMLNVTGFNHRLIRDFHFVSPAIGYAVGGNALFLKTFNGGLSWTTATLSPYSDLGSVHFTSANRGFTTLGASLYQSLNAGLSWTAQNVFPPTGINEVAFANDSIGYARGDNGIYKSLQPSVFTGLNAYSSTAGFRLYPNPADKYICLDRNSKDITRIFLYSANGQLVRSFTSGFEQMDISALSPGLYLVQVETSSTVFNARLVKN